MKKAVSIIAGLCLLYGCSGSIDKHTPAGYVAYMENPDHGCRKVIDAGGLRYTVQLVTPEYMAGKELTGKDGHVNDTAWQKRLSELKGYIFFLVKMARKNKEGGTEGTVMADQDHAVQLEAYYNQAAAADMTLLQGQSELRPATYHFENNYGLSPENTIVVGFETGGNTSDDLTLTFNDRYTNTPMIRAAFSQSTISQLPNIQL